MIVKRRVGNIVLVEVSYFKTFVYILGPFAAVFAFGYTYYGSMFFSLHHWLNVSTTLVNPTIGLSVFIATFFASTLYIADIILAKGCLVSTNGESLILKGRKSIRLDDIVKNDIALTGFNMNVILLPMKSGSNVKIPLLLAKPDPEDALKSIVGSV